MLGLLFVLKCKRADARVAFLIYSIEEEFNSNQGKPAQLIFVVQEIYNYTQTENFYIYLCVCACVCVFLPGEKQRQGGIISGQLCAAGPSWRAGVEGHRWFPRQPRQRPDDRERGPGEHTHKIHTFFLSVKHTE